jgi:FkbM family methyltransferase
MQTKLSKYTIDYFNEQEFHLLKNEIFTNNCYYFETNNPEPVIIDIGAYIGLSILYFKKLYPNSTVIAFEPNPKSFKKLEENIFNNDIKKVDIFNSAIWIKDGYKEMYVDNTNMNRFSVASFNKDGWNKEVKSKKIRVKTEKIDKYISQSVDLLKLDVEGSEQRILKSILPYFNNIKNIIIEYHPTDDQNIEKIIKILDKNYKIIVSEDGKEIKKNIPKNKLLTIKATYKH